MLDRGRRCVTSVYVDIASRRSGAAGPAVDGVMRGARPLLLLTATAGGVQHGRERLDLLSLGWHSTLDRGRLGAGSELPRRLESAEAHGLGPRLVIVREHLPPWVAADARQGAPQASRDRLHAEAPERLLPAHGQWDAALSSEANMSGGKRANQRDR